MWLTCTAKDAFKCTWTNICQVICHNESWTTFTTSNGKTDSVVFDATCDKCFCLRAPQSANSAHTNKRRSLNAELFCWFESRKNRMQLISNKYAQTESSSVSSGVLQRMDSVTVYPIWWAGAAPTLPLGTSCLSWTTSCTRQSSPLHCTEEAFVLRLQILHPLRLLCVAMRSKCGDLRD